MNERNKRIITILSIFTIIFTLMGGTLAYWNWSSTTRTGVSFTLDKDFSCSADGGGNITPSTISLEPSTCDNPDTSIKRKIIVTPDIKKDGIKISLDLWLNINSIGTGLSNSVDFKYVLTTSESSCEEGVISEGNFNSKTSGDKVMLLEKNYTADASEPYYLYIWLDKEETDIATANQSFNFSLGGNCSNYTGEPEAPVLDPGMIPVTIANDGTVTTVSSDDPNWYNYEEKEWANIVLVNENATPGVTDSHPRSYYQDNIGEEVTEEDILAYYVWIPRYKYKMEQPYVAKDVKCSEIPNVSFENNPGCYDGPYSMSEEDKEILKQSLESCGYECTMENPDYNPENGGVDEEGNIIPSTLDGYNPEPLLAQLLLGKEMTVYDGAATVGEFNIGEYIEYKGLDIEFSGIFNSNNIAPFVPTIDIVFESKEETRQLGDAVNSYYSHPAFWWDNDNDNVFDEGETLSGIWVGKFESSNNSGLIKIIPNVYSGIFDSISGYFNSSKNIASSTYGIDNTKTNAHMAKNREWGAVSYLAYSKYGINATIAPNTDGSQHTGNKDVWDKGYFGSGASRYPQTTTGNTSGIFDMVYGGIEYVMGNWGNELGDSGFTEMPERKYYDLYPREQFTFGAASSDEEKISKCTLDYCGGHALNETMERYYLDIEFVYQNQPWLARGNGSGGFGGSMGQTHSVFSFLSNTGETYYLMGSTWRSVLINGFNN